jgi:hypothetical protein
MRIKNFKPLAFLYNFIVMLVLGSLLFGASLQVAAGAFAASFITGTLLTINPKLALMAIQVEIWQNHIEEEIFKDNSFLRFSKNADDYVINSRAVHIPQSGGSGNVVKNRTSLPANVRKRNDTDVIYLLDEFTTDPVLIPNADTHELSYDKRSSVLGEDRDKLVETIAEETIYNWLNSPLYQTYAASSIPAGNKLRTTGATAVPATAESATGNRKAATLNDLQRMQNYFRTINKWKEGKMYCMLPPGMLTEMFPADSVVTATYMQAATEQERRNGVIMKAQGWNIMSRSSVARTQEDGTVIAPGATGTATDDEAALFWYHDAVEFAFGGVEAFENLKDPQFYGDIYSFLARTGSRARRADYKGIALLRQDKAV